MAFRDLQDSFVIEDLQGQPIDPSCRETSRTAKLALDATGTSE